MPKIAVKDFHIPLIRLEENPYKENPEDKLYWVDFVYETEAFKFDELVVADNGRTLQVRNLRTLQGIRSSFQFKGIPEKALTSQRHLFAATWPVAYDKKAYLVPMGAQNKRPKDEKYRLKAEILNPEGILVHLKWIDGPNSKAIAVVTSEHSFACVIGLNYHLETENHDVLETALLTSGTVESRDLADYLAKTFKFPGLPSVNALYSINLRVHGWVILAPPLADEEFEGALASGPVRIMEKALAQFTKKMRNACAQPGGMEKTLLEEKMALPKPVFEMLSNTMVSENQLRIKDHWYLPVGDPQNFLSPLAKSLLAKLDLAGIAGIDLAVEGDEVFRKTLRALSRMDLAIETESPWVYSLAAWKKISEILCGPGTLAKEWKISEVKEALDCSRKPLLGILNHLEAEGLVEWRGDCRVVVQEVPEVDTKLGSTIG